MKNKKKLLIFIVVIALLAFITLFFVYYYKESSLLTSNDKKWLSENNKKIVDIDVLNDVSVYAMNGTGVIFDFLDYISDETGLQFNKVPYSKEETPTGKNYKVEILDGSTTLDNNQLFIFEDSYVAISTKPIKINKITDFSGYKLGVLTSDESNVSYYLKSVKDITYHPQANIEALFKTLNDGNIDMLIVPNMLSLENTLNNEDYSLNYFFTDMTKKIVLTLDSNKKDLNNIIKKYFNYWQKEYYVSDYNKLLLNYYLSERKINDKTKADLLSKTYVYGYVENSPYETTRKNKIVGVAAEYINRLIRLTDIDFSYKKYNTVDELNQAIKNGDVDIYFNYINSEDSKYLKTISPFIENYVVLAKTSDDYVISSFEGLKGKNIYMLGNYQALYKYINSLAKVNTKTYDNIKKMVKESKKDKTLIIVDKELYTYYKNSEFKDYEVIYTDIMSNDYTFNVKSSNSSFYSLFNYVINTNSYYKYRNMGFNSLNASIFEKTSFEELYLLILAIILVPIIIIILIIILLKNRHKLKLVKKEDRKKYTDMLTSLKNRNYLNLQIDSWNLSKVYPQTIVIVDINNLKYINDNYGREKGDNLIVRVASILVNTQLENTEIVRTDGTEFLIYLVGYSENQIDIYLKKLRKELTELPYGFGASVGYSMIFDNIKTIDDAINEAMIDMQSDKSEF
ncbi:MAG: GGDEF domain-containing protein [Erysipelotrichaceae bacterium]|nr:GGDEF domain-containing protein [Erysipelotrichaceae bacterium]